MTKPVLIKLHDKSSFTDLDYLTQQIFTFSCISWRSFFPSSIPVTILYSNLIASLLGNLREIPGWDSDVINSKLKFSKWFL